MTDDLARRLKWARNKAGLTQRDLAKHVGVSAQAIQHLESGSSRTSRHIHKLANALGVSIEWLDIGVGDPDAKVEIRTQLEQAMIDLGVDEPVVVLAPSDENTKLAFFPVEEITYRPDHLPVYVSVPLVIAASRNKAYFRLIDDFKNIVELGGSIKEAEIENVTEMLAAVCTAALPDDYIPRPPYLAGQIGSYGLYPAYSRQLYPRLTGSELLHVNPAGRPEERDIVVVWLKRDVFILAEFKAETDDHLVIEVYHPFPTSYRPVRLALSEVKAVHHVRGLEYTEPRTAKVKFGRYITMRDGKAEAGVTGLGGVDPTTYEGPEDPD